MKAKVSCSTPFLPLGLSWEGLQPWLEAAVGHGMCAHTAGEDRAAMLLAWWLAPHGTHQGSAVWQGGWSHLQTYMHGSARYPSKLGRLLWWDALKILCPGGKHRTVAVPEAWLPQPQAPSSPPFPRLSTVGDHFCSFSQLSLPAPSVFETMSHFLSSDPTFQNFLFPLQGYICLKAFSESRHWAYLWMSKSASGKQHVLVSDDVQPSACSHICAALITLVCTAWH